MTSPLSATVASGLAEIATGNGRGGDGGAASVAGLDAAQAATELTDLLELPAVGLAVERARVVGRGARASADVYLSDGTAMTFETMRDVGTVSRLVLEVVACTGAMPKLKATHALRAVALIRALAEHHETFTEDEVAVEWGTNYLQAAQVADLDFNDQADRWKAFSALEHIDPAAGRFGRDIATASFVLRHTTGLRLVRCGWFKAFVRAEDNVTGPEIAHRMARVGWTRRGSTGRIKASRTGRPGQLAWSFYEVPAGWEDQS